MDLTSVIKEARVVELTKKLVSIPSTTNKEHELSDWYAEHLSGLGLKVTRLPVEESGDTVVAELGEGKESLMLNWHVDTFDAFEGWRTDPFKPVTREGRIIGLGAHDMKGGAACALAAVEAIVESGVRLKGRLVVSATTDEENWSRGAHAVIKSGALRGCGGCLVPEPSAAGTLTVGERGRHVFHLRFRGEAASAAYGGGVNAVVDASRAVDALARIPQPDLGWSDEYGMGGTLTVIGLRGGGTMIYVPELADVWVDRHILPGQTREWAEKQIRDTVDAVKTRGSYELTCDERPTPAPASFVVPHESRLVQVVRKHLEREQGQPIRFVIARSVADTNHFAVHGGVPTLICGPSGGNTCQANEWVDVASLAPTARMLAGSVLELLGSG